MWFTTGSAVPAMVNDPVKGVWVVITGIIVGATRTQALAEITRRGGYAQTAVTKSTGLLIIGRQPGKTKLTAARRWGTPTMDGADFWSDDAKLIPTVSTEELLASFRALMALEVYPEGVPA
jgi:NAD-dependent DNA ligase